MSIEIILGMQWSKLNWELSWSSIVKLDDLLPKIGGKYFLPDSAHDPIVKAGERYFKWKPLLSPEHTYIKEGVAYFIWKPPHSELNGWFDDRPSEILKSYVIKCNVSKDIEGKGSLQVEVTGVLKLRNFFDEYVSEQSISTFSAIPAPYKIDDTRYVRQAKAGELIYLHGAYSGNTWFDIICSREGQNLTLHYYSQESTCGSPWAVIGRYLLNDEAKTTVESLKENAEIMTDNTSPDLRDYEVSGAAYR